MSQKLSPFVEIGGKHGSVLIHLNINAKGLDESNFGNEYGSFTALPKRIK